MITGRGWCFFFLFYFHLLLSFFYYYFLYNTLFRKNVSELTVIHMTSNFKCTPAIISEDTHDLRS